MFFFSVGHVFSSIYSPTSPRSFTKLPDISSRGSFFKGQGHRGQMSNFCISAVLGPICMNLGECIQVDQIKIYGSNWVKGHRGQRSNLFFFSVCSSQVLGPIFTKLGGKVEGGPGY